MGILAPLYCRLKSPEKLTLTTGLGTLKSALGFAFFAGVLWVMQIASRPLLSHPLFIDPVLGNWGIWISRLLPAVSAVAGLVALALLGYRKSIELDAHQQILSLRISLWGIALRQQQISFADIKTWQLQNKTPKRYRPEDNPKNKAVGYWQLQIVLTNDLLLLLDRAPRYEEVADLQQEMENFVRHPAIPLDKPVRI